MSSLMPLNTSMYKDCIFFSKMNEKSFPHYFVLNSLLNKIGGPNVKLLRQQIQSPVCKKAPGLGERKMVEGTVTIVGVSQKLVIEYDEAQHQIQLKSKAMGKRSEAIKKPRVVKRRLEKMSQFSDDKDQSQFHWQTAITRW